MVYGSLAGADAFHAERGNAEWAAAPEVDRAAALQRASDYIWYHYAVKIVSDTPRDVLEAAAYTAAAVELQEPGFFAVVRNPSKPAKVLVGVKGIQWQVVGGGESYPVSSLIEAMLAPYISTAPKLVAFVV